MLAALGIVFGDIGTSPLYALQTVFAIDDGAVHPTADDVYGVISMIFWSTTLIVSIKYVGVLMRADNEGEGGVMALTALARRLYADKADKARLLVVIGIIGVSLFYGDSLITPAIAYCPRWKAFMCRPAAWATSWCRSRRRSRRPVRACSTSVPARRARSSAGDALWPRRWASPVSPGSWRSPGCSGPVPELRLLFVVDPPVIAFIAMGAVVLVITGAEALYADMGHFGRPPILRAWFFVVFRRSP